MSYGVATIYSFVMTCIKFIQLLNGSKMQKINYYSECFDEPACEIMLLMA